MSGPANYTKQKKKKILLLEKDEKSSKNNLAHDTPEGYSERFHNTVGMDNVLAGLLAMNQLYNALPSKVDTMFLNQINALLASLEPQDAYEGLLVQQMTTCHLLHLEATRCAYRTEYNQVKQSYMKQAMQLARTYAQLLETLTKKRNKGNQKITVQHVNVEGGGQAIVGNVQHGGKG